MKKNLIISGILALYLVAFWNYYDRVIRKQPEVISELQFQISEKKRQLLSAQILSRNLQNVHELIQNNLIDTPDDSLAKPANITFLKYLTGLMDDLGIVLVAMKPMDVVQQAARGGDQDTTALWGGKEFIEIPYSMTVLASYAQFGRLLEALEKSPRLIKVVRFQLDNPLDASYHEEEIRGKPDQHRVNLDIHTLTILKASHKGEPG